VVHEIETKKDQAKLSEVLDPGKSGRSKIVRRPEPRQVGLLARADSSTIKLPRALRGHRSFLRILRRCVTDKGYMESIFKIRDNVLRSTLNTRQNHGLVIALSGVRGSEGTSMLSLLLSLSLGANQHQKVAFLDGLFDEERFEVLSQIFGLGRNEAAAVETGAGQLWGCFSADQPNTCFLKSEHVRNGFDFFSHKRLRDFLDDLRQQYDFTIVDMPPLLKESSNIFLAPQADQLYLVSSSRKTKLSDFERCLEVVEQQDTEVSGVILNRHRAPLWSRIFWKDYFR